MFSSAVTEEDVDDFLDHLAGRGWVKARKLKADLGINDRHARALAEASRGRVISGNRGYKLTAEATAEERNECLHRLRNQADRMQARSSIIERVWQEAQPTATTAF